MVKPQIPLEKQIKLFEKFRNDLFNAEGRVKSCSHDIYKVLRTHLPQMSRKALQMSIKRNMVPPSCQFVSENESSLIVKNTEMETQSEKNDITAHIEAENQSFNENAASAIVENSDIKEENDDIQYFMATTKFAFTKENLCKLSHISVTNVDFEIIADQKWGEITEESVEQMPFNRKPGEPYETAIANAITDYFQNITVLSSSNNDNNGSNVCNTKASVQLLLNQLSNTSSTQQTTSTFENNENVTTNLFDRNNSITTKELSSTLTGEVKKSISFRSPLKPSSLNLSFPLVTTGEEDEEKLFGEPAKLYRYDASNRKWKERAIGEMKILYHPVNGSYRFLLRHEQTFKCVLNHQLSADLSVTPTKTSDKVFVWAACNHGEDSNGDLEQLSVRFKDEDIATRFDKVVKSRIEKLKVKTIFNANKPNRYLVNVGFEK